MRRRRGFTLLELMVVVIFIALLAGIAVLKYIDMRNAAIAAGNSGDRGLIGRLRPLTEDEDAVVAEAARWALDRLERG